MRQTKLVCEAIAVAKQAALWMQKEQQQQQQARYEATDGVPALAREHHRIAETATLPREDGCKEEGPSVDTDELVLLESELASDSAFEEEESRTLLAKPVQRPSMDDSGIVLKRRLSRAKESIGQQRHGDMARREALRRMQLELVCRLSREYEEPRLQAPRLDASHDALCSHLDGRHASYPALLRSCATRASRLARTGRAGCRSCRQPHSPTPTPPPLPASLFLPSAIPAPPRPYPKPSPIPPHHPPWFSALEIRGC